ncbi:MAG: hypothetical protein KIT43_13240 [Bauldia sp.]|nr:hypothetical protein [Bauldia sp.]
MKKIVLTSSAAAIALAAAASAAQAADVMPIVVPVVTPAVVPPPGPVKVVQIDTTLSGYPSGLSLDTYAGVDVRSVSGWGFNLIVGNSVFLDGPPLDGFIEAEGRIYRAIGNGTVGVFASTGAAFTLGLGVAGIGTAFGIDADYKTDDVHLYYSLGAMFSGGFDGIQSLFAGSIDRGNFKVDVISLVIGPPLFGLASAKVGYSFGPITPYVRVLGAFTGGGFGGLVGAGVDLEHTVGDRLTLTANAEVDLGFSLMGTTLAWTAEAGFEYTIGAVGGPLSLRGNVGGGPGPGLSFEIGIGLKFGGGRVTGIGGIVFDDLLDDFLL